MMNRQGFSSSSFFSEEVCFSDERQAAVRKMEHANSYSDGLLRTEGIASPPLGNQVPLNSQMTNGFPPDYYVGRGQHMNILLGRRVFGAERAVSHSLPSAVHHNIGARRNLKADSSFMGAQYDNGIFPSSLSDLFTRNYNVAADGAVTSLRYEDDAAFESLEELEAKTIGNLLPDDDDDLFSGVTDGFNNIVRPNNVEDVEDLDLFSSVGGMELGEDGFSKRNSELERVQPGGSKRLLQHFSSKLNLEDSDLVWRRHNRSSNRAVEFPGPLSYGDTTCTDDVYNPANCSSITESGHLQQNHLNFELQRPRNLHPQSFPELYDGLTNVHTFCSPNNVSVNMSPPMQEMIDGQQFHRVDSNGRPIELTEVFRGCGNACHHTTGRHYTWENSNLPKPRAVMWPNAPSFVNGIAATHPHQQFQAVARAQSSMLNALLPLSSPHIGSAPSVNPSIWDRRHAYAGESPDASVFHPGSLGCHSPHPLDFVTQNMYPCAGGNCMDVPIHPHHPRCGGYPARGQMHPMTSSFDRRNDSSSNLADNRKQFELDIDRIASGEDKRTTLMIKNIPNKYTSKMLLAAIDERHKGTYDFIYLPIDFKNKCNVGYAFINMIDPTLIVPLYETFNGKKWEKFNSEKVASLAYARIQGKTALVAHFQNSSLMNEDKRCRPILFHTDGPNAGDQVPFPAGTNIRSRADKIRSSTSDENLQASPSKEDHTCSGHWSSSGSVASIL